MIGPAGRLRPTADAATAAIAPASRRGRAAGRPGGRAGKRGAGEGSDAVTAIHRHCAVYTGPEAVEALLDLVGWTPEGIAPEWRLLEPACGDGSFLFAALDRLLDWAETCPGADLEPMVRAYEFDRETVTALRPAVAARLEERGLSREAAGRLAEAWIRHEDFLLAAVDFPCTHVVGNPPYMRWSFVPGELRAAYEAALPRTAARGDLCLAFLWKATRFAQAAGSRIGFLCADRWLRCAYGRDVRSELAASHALVAHLEVHGLPVFKGARKVGAYAALTVLERGPAVAPERFATAVSMAHLRELAAARPVVGGDPNLRSMWANGRSGGALLAEHPVREMFEAVERGTLPLGSCGVSVRCGTALGVAKAFVVPEGADLEPDRVRPYLRSADVAIDGTVSPSCSVIDVWTGDGELVDLSSFPRVARHLRKFRAGLASRACAGRPADWYRTIDKIHADRIAEPKVVVAGMSRRARVGLDPGGHVASNGLYCLVSDRWPLDALAKALRAGILDLFGEILSPRFSGGTKRFDGNVLRQVRLPDWAGLHPALCRRVDSRALADGLDAGLVADLVGLRSAPHRAALDALLAKIADVPVTAGGQRP